MFSAYHSHKSFCIDVALVLPLKSGDSDMNHFFVRLNTYTNEQQNVLPRHYSYHCMLAF